LAAETQTTREISVLAEDPSVRLEGHRPLWTRVKIPAEPLSRGPRSSRIEVIDYDSSTGHFYEPYVLDSVKGGYKRPTGRPVYEDEEDLEEENILNLVNDPKFHAHHAFGVASSILFEFEKALGRSVSWGFANRSHQLKIVPHAFREANAFYSRQEEALLFGYFSHPKDDGRIIYTCLSHDIVAHETTHAILDGLRPQFIRPSSPDQAAFHEGFADIIALLANLRSESLIQAALIKTDKLKFSKPSDQVNIVSTLEKIKTGEVLTGLAQEMGQATGSLGRGALRNSIQNIEPDPTLINDVLEEHLRGEVLVAAVLRTFFLVWKARLEGKFKYISKAVVESEKAKGELPVNRDVDAWRVAEEGAKAAQHLMTMAIRAIDYLPPAHVEFRDFLMAMITSDWRTCPDDSTYHYRDLLLQSFAEFGIKPHAQAAKTPKGAYTPCDLNLEYSRGNNATMRSDCDAMFRFIWENRKSLGLVDDAYTRVSSVRPVHRVAPDGVILHETVAEYYQLIKDVTMDDLGGLEIEIPEAVRECAVIGAEPQKFGIYGGGTLIFDEYGRLKYHINNNLKSRRQSNRLAFLASRGQLFESPDEDRKVRSFAVAHLKRAFAGKRANAKET
jgi:hypothetical protein